MKTTEHKKAGAVEPMVSNLPSTIGRLEQAKRFALSDFDKWNDVTGFVAPHTSYYYELQSCLEDAVEYGFGVAHGQTFKEIRKHIKKKWLKSLSSGYF